MSIQRVTRKDGSTRWVARVYVDGRQVNTTARTRREAKQWEGEVLSARDKGTYVPTNSATTLSDHAEQWLDGLNLRPNTISLYRSHMRSRILPALGTKRIGQLRRADVQRWVTAMKSTGTLLSPATIRTSVAVLRICLNDAIEGGVIGSNAAVGVKLPERQPHPAPVLTGADIERIASHMPERYQVAVYLAAGAGLRLSEVLGLTVDRIEFLHKRVRVERQLQHGVLSPLKTASSRRVVPLDDMVLELLTEHMRRWPSPSLLLTSKVNKPVQRSVFEMCWKKAATAAGRPDVRFHDLRGWYGSCLVRAGVNVKTVAARMGHKDASLTLNTYASLWPDDGDVGRGAVSAAFQDLHASLHASEQ
jgi:integrase